MEDKKRNILFSEEQIKERVLELVKEITKDYEGFYRNVPYVFNWESK